MKLREDEVRVPAPDGGIRAILISPVGGGRGQGVVLYTDIFQLTESTLRTARWLASHGIVVCVPEIYPRGELAGVALEFDDAGKQAGLAGAAATTTAQFDADRVAVLDFLAAQPGVDRLGAVGFCIGGHLAFRAAFDSRSRVDGVLLPDRAAGREAGRRRRRVAGAGRGDRRSADDRLRVPGPARPGRREGAHRHRASTRRG